MAAFPKIPSSAKASRYSPPTEGNHVCVCSQIVDLGMQEGRFGRKKEVYLAFEVCDEFTESLDRDGPRREPKRVSTMCSNTVSEGSNLRGYIEGVLGRRLTDAEVREAKEDFTPLLLGKACLVNVEHKESNGNTYGNISSITPLPKSMSAPDPTMEWLVYSPEHHDEASWERLPPFLQTKIAKRIEAVKLGDAPATTAPAATPQVDPDYNDDIPF